MLKLECALESRQGLVLFKVVGTEGTLPHPGQGWAQAEPDLENLWASPLYHSRLLALTVRKQGGGWATARLVFAKMSRKLSSPHLRLQTPASNGTPAACQVHPAGARCPVPGA